MNYTMLKKELLIHLRGKIPQDEVNKKMGITFNKTYRWESGSTHLMWPDFIKLGKIFKVDIDGIIKTVFSFHEDTKKSHLLVKHFTGTSTQKEVSAAIGVSRYTLSRWLKGISHPTVEEMFALIDFTSPEFIRFLESVTDGVILPSAKERIIQVRSQSAHYNDFPWLSIFLSAIELKSYRKNPSKALRRMAKLSL